MKTKDQHEVKEVLETADKHFGDQPRHWTALFFLGKALVLAVCAIADGINQIVADLPSHD
jgi:hypothetical protein